VGFLFVKRLACDWKVKVKKRKYLSKVVEVQRDGQRILLAMPQTYMNASGQAVRQLVEGRPVSFDNLIVVYDDLDISLGEIRVRKEGSAGTHRGMASIIEEIQSIRFPRIRVGIGPLPADADAAEYVLSPFEARERPVVEDSFQKARMALELILTGGVEKAMNLFNQKN
jgi:PTH1 family peptidyl-tRNA hydrolase